MIVPDFWAEAKRKEVINGSQFTIKRFGWSNESEEDAFRNAKERVDEAMSRALKGEKVRKIDRKISYNGGEGLPIREEVIARHGDIVITRNTYGALCLNTPDVLFVDIDLDFEPSRKMLFVSFLVFGLLALSLGVLTSSWLMLFACLFLAICGAIIFADVLLWLSFMIYGSPEKQMRQALEGYVKKYNDANLRLYRTPNGFRVLALHRLFDPQHEDVKTIFSSLLADPIYAHMCLNQNCFRARVSPKPWRINMKRMGPKQGAWPIKKERIVARQVWVKDYEKASREYASCVFDASYGSNIIDPKAKLVMHLHDQLSRSGTLLPIA